MSANLDWHIGDAPAPTRPTPPPRPPRPPRAHWWTAFWLGLFMLTSLGLVLGLLVWRARQSQAEQRAALIEAARLEDTHALANDVELVLNTQTADYARWYITLGPNGLPRPVGTSVPIASPAGASPAVPGISGTPTLALAWGYTPADEYLQSGLPDYEGEATFNDATAELAVTRAYVAADGTAHFTLHHTQFYTLSDGRWLRSGPPTERFAEITRVPGHFLQLRYPTADADVIAPLITRLDALAQAACNDLGCREGPPSLIITADVALLAETATHPNQRALRTDYAPAPALLGHPATPGDPAALDAFYQFYGTRLVLRIAESTATKGQLWPNGLHWALAHLGLSHPLPPETLRATAAEAVRANHLGLTTPIPPPTAWLALDFLTSVAVVTPVRIALVYDSPDTYLLTQVTLRGDAWADYLARVADAPAPR